MFIRKSDERGRANHGWLKSSHSFSFADYYDPRFMGFKSLRVINEDFIAPESGFGTHPHNNMEIITYVVEGEITHEDSLGHKKKLRAGEIQVMSAGKGILHSEYNESSEQTTHLLQIWILPESLGGAPGYQQVGYEAFVKDRKWLTLVSPNADEALTQIKQQTSLKLFKGQSGEVQLPVHKTKAYWLQIIKGQLKAESGEVLSAGDALAFEGDDRAPTNWSSDQDIELLLFELAL